MSEHRYVLRRELNYMGHSGRALFVMLNPSTADDLRDDPTIRRLKAFARREGWAGVDVVNLFAARATRPEELLEIRDRVGPRNDQVLLEELQRATLVVAAWGAPHGPRGLLAAFVRVRFAQVEQLLGGRSVEWFCLGTTSTGAPRHPLYVRGDAPLERWRPEAWAEQRRSAEGA